MAKFASGKNALGECDRCGMTFKLLDLRKLTISGTQTELKVCDSCWEPDHPQLQPMKLTADAEALYQPRPDKSLTESRNITWGWQPVASLPMSISLGKVTVS